MTISVLVVDDNPDDRGVIKRILAGAPAFGNPVHEATDEASCLEMLTSRNDIDCVLLDYSMPGHDGLDVLRNILGLDPSMAVVMLTGHGSEHIAVEAMKLGAQDYIPKDTLSRVGLQRAIGNATERTRMQRKIREQHENLQSFARVLVHDIRAPLRSIQQAIGMLAEDLPPEIAADNAEVMDFVVQGAERLDHLVMALKAYTDADGHAPEFEAVDLNAQVEAVRSNLKSDIEAAGAVVECDRVLPTISGNPPQLQQLLQNIIGNGIKYNRSGAPLVSLSATDRGDRWEIAITDNGIGIDARHVEDIFRPFRRLHCEGEFEGTGIGLATCMKIAERHHGRLSCRSRPGQGSTFVLDLPKECAGAERADAAAWGPSRNLRSAGGVPGS